MTNGFARVILRILAVLCLVTEMQQVAAQYTTSDYDNIFSWVQTAYPDALQTTGMVKGSALGYYSRYYPSANAYLGMKDDGVYFYTAGLSAPLSVGPVSGFLSTISSCKPRTMESTASTILSGRLSVTFEDTAGVSSAKGLKRRFVLKNLTSSPMYLTLTATSTWGRVTIFAPQPGFAYIAAGAEFPGMIIVESSAGDAAGATSFDLTLAVTELSTVDGSAGPSPAKGSVTRPTTFTLTSTAAFSNPSGTATVQFEQVSQVTTKTGFWTYGVDDVQSMIVLFPGQEHWSSASLVAQSAIYAYKLDGTLLWKKDTGAEIWGGDLSRDGKYVVYATVYDTNATTSPSLVLLDAATGQQIWKKSVDFATFPRPSAAKVPVPTTPVAADTPESREARFSPSGKYIGFGTMRGLVYLIDRDTGAVRWSYETLGQVRGISFDAAETRAIIARRDTSADAVNLVFFKGKGL